MFISLVRICSYFVRKNNLPFVCLDQRHILAPVVAFLISSVIPKGVKNCQKDEYQNDPNCFLTRCPDATDASSLVQSESRIM